MANGSFQAVYQFDLGSWCWLDEESLPHKFGNAVEIALLTDKHIPFKGPQKHSAGVGVKTRTKWISPH